MKRCCLPIHSVHRFFPRSYPLPLRRDVATRYTNHPDIPGNAYAVLIAFIAQQELGWAQFHRVEIIDLTINKPGGRLGLLCFSSF